MWIGMTPDDRAAILGMTPKPATASTPPPQKKKGFQNSNRKVNLTEISAYDFLVMQHEMQSEAAETDTPSELPDAVDNNEPTRSVNSTNVTDDKKDALSVTPADLRRFLGSKSGKQVTIDGKPHFMANVTLVDQARYVVSAHRSDSIKALVDRGSNGGVAGTDVRIISKDPNHTVTIEGIDRHQLNNIPICTVGGVVNSSHGEIILVLPNYAHVGRGHSILCPTQMEYFGTKVDDKSKVIGGKQSIITINNISIPLDFDNGLPRLAIRPFSDEEWETLPQVFMADDSKPWDPRVMDNTLSDDQEWLESQPPPSNPYQDFDQEGTYKERSVYLAELPNWSWDVWGVDEPTTPLLPDDIQGIGLDFVADEEEDSYSDNVDDLVMYAHHLKVVNEIGELESNTFGTPFASFSCTVLPSSDEVRLINVRTRSMTSQEHGPRPVSPEPNIGETGVVDKPPEEHMDPAPPPEPPPLAAHTNQSTPHSPRVVTPSQKDWDSLRPMFGWLNTTVIQRTFDKTTQYARMPQSEVLRKQYKSPYPWANVHRRNEDLATDTVFSDTPAVDGGETCAQFFTGLSSQVVDVIGMKSEKQFVNTLEDIIIDRGAPNRLLSDSARVETSQRVQAILRALFIGSWQSTPYESHQKPSERRWQTVKTLANVLLDRCGAPPELWLECLRYTCFLLNHTYNENIKDVPMNRLTGSTVDISPLLRFHWYQEVYYKMDDSSFPSDTKEEKGYVVGIAEHVGHIMTYRIFDPVTRKILNRGNLRACDTKSPNKRLDLISGEDLAPPSKSVIKSIKEHDEETGEHTASNQTDPATSDVPVFNPHDLVGRSFLMDKNEDGTRYRARIVEAIEGFEDDLGRNPTRIKFKISVNNDEFEELIAYNEVVNHITADESSGILWKFRRIIAHEGPLKESHPSYKGSKWNIMVEWENGEITTEPLNVIAADDPTTCATYAMENNLLELDGWKRFKRLARRNKKLVRMVNQSKLRSFNSTPKYMFGYEIPRNYKHAMEIDKRNGNTKWKEAIELEMLQLNEYNTFRSLGLAKSNSIPAGYKRIRTHLVFAVKHDGRHKARMVADGHLTDAPLESVYSGVVSLRGFRLVVFLAELNKIETWSTDIGNAYLEAKTKEKLVVIAGPEYGELEGHLLVIEKALYGLRTSGLRWHERFAHCLREMGFTPCRAEPDIWMRPEPTKGECYEYIAVYVDDLAMVLKDPQAFVDVLEKKYNFKLKGTGPIKYHLGMDFKRDDDGTLRFEPSKYIEKMMDSYKRLFGEYPSMKCYSPLEANDHPELDTSEFLDEEQTSIYQSLIGALQWIITIGRFDIQVAVMSLSSFRVAPRRGHLERIKRIYGYIRKFDKATIRFRTSLPDFSELPDQVFDWSHSVYGNPKEVKPTDAPPPLGNPVITTSYKDANLMHDIMTGRSVTGILHFVNKTPIDWYAKKMSTVETATYGAEYVSARTCVEQLIDLRNTLRYLGVPVHDHSYMFGDNRSVVDSSIMPHSKLNKRHTMLSFHKVREAIASGMIRFYHIYGTTNPSDILSKHWSHSDVWPVLQALLFYPGDTLSLLTPDAK